MLYRIQIAPILPNTVAWNFLPVYLVLDIKSQGMQHNDLIYLVL